MVYTFKHALTHEVAYGGLLHERRRLLHAQIVSALEALYADRIAEQIERLAHHAVRGEVGDKALIYCPAGWSQGVCACRLPRGGSRLGAGTGGLAASPGDA